MAGFTVLTLELINVILHDGNASGRPNCDQGVDQQQLFHPWLAGCPLDFPHTLGNGSLPCFRSSQPLTVVSVHRCRTISVCLLQFRLKPLKLGHLLGR
jgi:hypothetical protein